MIGLVLATALAWVPAGMAGPDPFLDPEMRQTAHPDVALSRTAGVQVVDPPHKRRRQPVPKPALWLGGTLALATTALMRIGGQRGATIDLRGTCAGGLGLVADCWRRVPAAMGLVALSVALTQVGALVAHPPLVGLALALLGALGLFGYLILPGAVCRLAFAPHAPDERFRIRRFGLHFGATESRVFGAIVVQLLIVAVIWFPLFVACGLLAPVIADGFHRAQEGVIGGLLSGLRPPTRRELDFACLAFVGQIVAARLIMIAPNAAVEGRMSILALWRATSTAWLKLASLVFALTVSWWFAAAVGPLIGPWIGRTTGPAGVLTWAGFTGLLSASVFAFQIATSILIFRQLAADPPSADP